MKSARAAARFAAVRPRTTIVLAAFVAVVLVGAGGVLAGSSPTGLLRFKTPASVPRGQHADHGRPLL
jgi:hypothetical protein